MARMGRPLKAEKDRARRLLSVRLTDAMCDWVEESARKNNQSVTEFVWDTLSMRMAREATK